MQLDSIEPGDKQRPESPRHGACYLESRGRESGAARSRASSSVGKWRLRSAVSAREGNTTMDELELKPINWAGNAERANRRPRMPLNIATTGYGGAGLRRCRQSSRRRYRRPSSRPILRRRVRPAAGSGQIPERCERHCPTRENEHGLAQSAEESDESLPGLGWCVHDGKRQQHREKHQRQHRSIGGGRRDSSAARNEPSGEVGRLVLAARSLAASARLRRRRDMQRGHRATIRNQRRQWDDDYRHSCQRKRENEQGLPADPAHCAQACS